MKLPHLTRDIRAFRPNKTTFVLLAALAIGGLAALGAYLYLSGREADIEARSRGRMVEVVVAAGDITKGAKLSNKMLAVRKIPAEYAHSTAVRPDQFELIDGQVIAWSVKSGEMIVWSLMEGKKVPTFSARVEAGRRAITVPVDEINSISGLLEPGDLIDLIVTVDQKGRKLTLPLMQSVQVMATGQRAIDDPKSGERRVYSTVTLDTDPAQAQNIIVARDAGRLTALLRNPQDRTSIRGAQGDLAALLGAAPADAPSGRDIPVLYGGRAGKIPPEALRMGGQGTAPAPPPVLAGADMTSP
jgi:pilus assembly protein CpaB